MKRLLTITSKITNKNNYNKYNNMYIKIGDEKT